MSFWFRKWFLIGQSEVELDFWSLNLIVYMGALRGSMISEEDIPLRWIPLSPPGFGPYILRIPPSATPHPTAARPSAGQGGGGRVLGPRDPHLSQVSRRQSVYRYSPSATLTVLASSPPPTITLPRVMVTAGKMFVRKQPKVRKDTRISYFLGNCANLRFSSLRFTSLLMRTQPMEKLVSVETL